jgi:hypothetical protein
MNNRCIIDKPLVIVLRSVRKIAATDIASFKFSNSRLMTFMLPGLVKSLVRVRLEDPELEVELE